MHATRFNVHAVVSVLAILLLIGATNGEEMSARIDFPASGDIETLREIVSAGFSERYAEAESLAISLQWRYPYHPIGFIMQAAMLQSKMLDHEHFSYRREFHTLIKLAKKKARDRLEKNENDPWSLYCLGLAHGSHAVFESRDGSWLTAVKQGVRAKKAFSRCVEIDPQFYDAYVGIGSYHYWRTVKTGIVNWLPFVQDDRQQGIRELEIAADSARFSFDFAKDALIWVYIDTEKYEKAESLAVQMQQKYPEGKKFLWGLAQARVEAEKYDRALTAYERLLKKVTEDPNRANHYNEIEIRRRIAECADELGRYSEVVAHAKVVMALEIAPDIRNRAGDAISELSNLAEHAEKQMENEAISGKSVNGKAGN